MSGSSSDRNARTSSMIGQQRDDQQHQREVAVDRVQEVDLRGADARSPRSRRACVSAAPLTSRTTPTLLELTVSSSGIRTTTVLPVADRCPGRSARARGRRRRPSRAPRPPLGLSVSASTSIGVRTPVVTPPCFERLQRVVRRAALGQRSRIGQPDLDAEEHADEQPTSTASAETAAIQRWRTTIVAQRLHARLARFSCRIFGQSTRGPMPPRIAGRQRQVVTHAGQRDQRAADAHAAHERHRQHDQREQADRDGDAAEHARRGRRSPSRRPPRRGCPGRDLVPPAIG